GRIARRSEASVTIGQAKDILRIPVFFARANMESIRKELVNLRHSRGPNIAKPGNLQGSRFLKERRKAITGVPRQIEENVDFIISNRLHQRFRSEALRFSPDIRTRSKPGSIVVVHEAVRIAGDDAGQ